MGVKAGYKQTEVGVIPEDWDVRPLNTIAKVTSGKRLPLGYFVGDKETPYPYVRVTDMRRGWVDTSDIKYVPEAAYPPISKYRIFKDDLFISVAGTLGIVGAIPDELDGANLTENADRISAIICEKNYLLHVMLSPVVQGVIESEQTVGAQPKLALIRIRNFSIPLPPTAEEQRAIAAALSDVDALLDGLDRLIAKKRALKQATMQQLLTGQTRLPGFGGEWETRRLGELAKIASGGTPLSMVRRYYGGGIPWVSIADMTGAGKTLTETAQTLTPLGVSNSAAQMFPAGTLLYAMYASIGECTMAGVPVSTSQAILGISPGERLDHEFLYYSLAARKRAVRLLGQQGTQANLNKGIVQGFEMPLPSAAEQTAIARVLSDMDAELDALEARRDKTRQIKQGMMQELLTGKTRLVRSED